MSAHVNVTADMRIPFGTADGDEGLSALYPPPPGSVLPRDWVDLEWMLKARARTLENAKNVIFVEFCRVARSHDASLARLRRDFFAAFVASRKEPREFLSQFVPRRPIPRGPFWACRARVREPRDIFLFPPVPSRGGEVERRVPSPERYNDQKKIDGPKEYK